MLSDDEAVITHVIKTKPLRFHHHHTARDVLGGFIGDFIGVFRRGVGGVHAAEAAERPSASSGVIRRNRRGRREVEAVHVDDRVGRVVACGRGDGRDVIVVAAAVAAVAAAAVVVAVAPRPRRAAAPGW